MAGNPEFGRRIRELREAKKQNDPRYSLRRFAEMVGISATFLSKVEVGEFAPPAANNIKRMAELLDADPDELLALAGKMDPELSEIIRTKPRMMADLLRTAHEADVSEKQVESLLNMMKTMNEGGKKGQ